MPQWEPDEAAGAFYEEAAAGAAALGVCVDVYAASEGGCGLAQLHALATRSGGALYLYPRIDAAALPQASHAPFICVPDEQCTVLL